MRPILAVLAAALFFLGFVPEASAQNDRWQASPSFRVVQALSASGDALWAGTEGGVFRYDTGSGEIERYTPVQGLSRVDVQAIAYDEARGAVWIGYADGVLDRLDAASGEVQPFFDIAQADRFNARGIHRIEVAADSLLISTGFGVVVFDVVRNEVSDTYERFGSFPSGTAARDVLFAPLPDGRPGVWVGTRAGIAYAPLDTPNFREPAAWTIDEEAPGDVLSLAFFDETVFAGAERILESNGQVVEPGDVRIRNADGSWDRAFYTGESVYDLLVGAERLVSVSDFLVTARERGGSAATFNAEGVSVLRAGVLTEAGRFWGGDAVLGLVAFPDLRTTASGTVEVEQTILPDGPTTNRILALDVDEDGAVWVGYESPNNVVNGFGRLGDSGWVNFSTGNGALPDRGPVVDIHVGSRGSLWFATANAGLFEYGPDGEITLFDPSNSTIRPSSPSNDDFIVTEGVTTDEEGRVWVTNFNSPLPLHVRTPEGEWTGLSRPAGIPSDTQYESIYIDSFGQKWINGRRGTGIVVLDTGADPLDDADDRAVAVRSVGSVGTGLPDAQVNAIVEDRSGRMWLGTGRGLATIFSPGSAFAGDLSAQITWARTPDGTSFFLRDLRIFDIAVDPADRKWLASSSGAWLLNAEGNEILANFTTENSPLPNDLVSAVEVDDESGAVHFATSGGLYTYRGDAVAASPTAEELFVYPNPVRGHGGALPEIAIEGLVDDAEVRVLTVDGQLVASFRTRGGSVRWDGRDQRTGAFVPSGVYLVAAAGQDGEGTAYGKIAVIR